jgi:DMSO/TMAO reductase YedYZ molybdopterin-dependent catalytic subunit
VVDPMGPSFPSRQTYRPRDISAFHRVNGYPPPDPHYQRMAAGGFTDYRLSVEGLVARPLSLSLTELRELGWQTHITKHNCIQGWTAIAEWGGVPLDAVLRQARPTAQARYVVLHAFDDKTITEDEDRHGVFYGTIPLFVARRTQTILALEMNGEPLPVPHGAPVRLRVECQLGFKMVKWIRLIELVSDYRRVGQGQGGWREDQQYYTTSAGI